ncbi:hypothetical protein [Mammaliicoccus sp. JADD-157]|uniref:hypothetical protein n=1 Tax=Mammaliicoccus sp. JADD-157 TaxID=3404818 RepID=UPI003BB5F12D
MLKIIIQLILIGIVLEFLFSIDIETELISGFIIRLILAIVCIVVIIMAVYIKTII